MKTEKNKFDYWQKIFSVFLALIFLNVVFTETNAQTRLELGKKSSETTNETEASRLSLTPTSKNSLAGPTRVDLAVGSQRLVLKTLKNNNLEYNQYLRIQQVGEVTTQLLARGEIKSQNNPKVETPLEKADRLLKQGELATAKEIYQKILSNQENSAQAYSGLGYIYLQEKDVDLAINAYQKAVEIDEKDVETRVNFGVALYRNGLIEQAIHQYEEALKASKKKLPIAQFNLAMAYAHLGDLENAKSHYLDAIKQTNNVYPEAANNLGLVYEAQGNTNEAIKYFEMAIKTQYGNAPIGEYNLARQYQNKNKLYEAEKGFKLALSQQQNFPEAYLSLGNLYLTNTEGSDNPEKSASLLAQAIDCYQKALEQRKNIYPLAHENLAIALTKAGKKTEAYTHYRLAFEQYGSQNVETLQNLVATLCSETGGVSFLIYNELSQSGNPGNLNCPIGKKSSRVVQTDNTEKTAKANVIDEQQIKDLYKEILAKYDDVEETEKNLPDVRYCGAQAYLATGNINEAISELVKAAKLSKYKDKKIMEDFSSLLITTVPIYFR